MAYAGVGGLCVCCARRSSQVIFGRNFAMLWPWAGHPWVCTSYGLCAPLFRARPARRVFILDSETVTRDHDRSYFQNGRILMPQFEPSCAGKVLFAKLPG